MKSNKLTNIIESLRAAATDIKSEIQALDQKIIAAHAERSALINAPLSREDYLTVMKADIKKKAKPMENMLKLHLERFPVSFSNVMRSPGALPLNILDVGRLQNGFFSEEAAYFYLGDQLIRGLEVAIADMDWPDESVSMAERTARIGRLDVEIASLEEERDQLAGQLLGAGVTQ